MIFILVDNETKHRENYLSFRCTLQIGNRGQENKRVMHLLTDGVADFEAVFGCPFIVELIALFGWWKSPAFFVADEELDGDDGEEMEGEEKEYEERSFGDGGHLEELYLIAGFNSNF